MGGKTTKKGGKMTKKGGKMTKMGGKMTKMGGKMTKMGGKSPCWSSGSSHQQVFCLLLLLMGTGVEILSESLSLLLLKEFKHTMMPYFCFDHCWYMTSREGIDMVPHVKRLDAL